MADSAPVPSHQHREQQQQPVLSVAKTLTKLLAVSSNRSCADCRATLVDSSQIHVSISHCDYSQQHHHQSNGTFPKQAKTTTATLQKVPEARHLTQSIPLTDPALLASQRVGGHGVFVCSRCAAAHELLGTNCAVVHSVQDTFQWKPDELVQLVKSGGNARSWSVLEAYLPPSWEWKRPKADSSIGDRLVFIRAKYEALAFVLPQPGPLAQQAWSRIIQRHPEWNDLWGSNGNGDDTASLADIDMGYGDSNMVHAVMNPASANRELPDRLVDFFCVVGCSDYIDPLQATTDLSATKGPEDILLVPCVTDCYPAPDSHNGLEFPEHVSTFLFPEGCQGTSSARAPCFFTFVLTTANGDRLYGGALRFYDDDRDIDYYQQALDNSEYKGPLPKWLSAENDPLETSQHSCSYSDVVFLPQCLVVLSHYPFFDTWRKFLLQLYRIALVEAPLPIERFIANFVSEVPLPPPGKIQVKFGFTVHDMWTIQRPPDNELPLTNFSFKPLFASLSTSNVMIVFACLLSEMRIALCSRCYSILGPVAEALTSLLFPFHWEGMYLPIMPYSMLDILDAPVPYLVGLHSRYLAEVQPEHRPRGVVFVDLDSDVVHLGFDDSEDRVRDIPCLPERHAAKLKAKLMDFASSVYIKPATTNSALVTCGAGHRPPISRRPSYVGLNESATVRSKARRRDILSHTEKAYRQNDLQVPVSGFLTEHGQLVSQEALVPPSHKKTTPSGMRPLRRMTRSKSHEALESAGRVAELDEHGLLDLDEPEGFSTQEIREAFLRFFVALLQNYRLYLSETEFQATEYVQNLGLGPASAAFCEEFVKTQLFHRFIDERREWKDPEVRFFDESINAKINRSRKSSLMNFGRADVKDTTFLDDSSRAIKDTFTPPPPSNWGLPDDGRRYTYGKFPKLKSTLYGKTRPPRKWQSDRRQTRRASLYKHQSEQAAFYQTMAPMLRPGKSLIPAAKRGSKSLENALGALSNVFESTKSTENIPSNSPHSPFLDRSLHSNLKTSTYNKTAAPSLSSDKIKNERNSDLISSAETLVMNARRKQSILVGIFVAFQSRQKLTRGSLATDSFESSLQALGLTSLYKTKGTELTTSEAATTIQASYRRHHDCQAFRHARWIAILVQSLARSRRTRWVFQLLRRSIVKFQAVARGLIARKLLCGLVEDRLSIYRRHIFQLWQCACTPLTYRTNFWFVAQFSGILQLGIAEDEVTRLWHALKFQLPSNAEQELHARQSNDALFLSAMRLGVKYRIHCQVSMLGDNLERHSGADPEQIKVSSSRESAERGQVYEKLSAITSNERLMGYFHRFGVNVRTKKKLELAALTWTKFQQADDSTMLMLELFPELRHTTNIVFGDASKKGSRRFRRSNQVPVPLERPMWAHEILSNRIHEHVREVADVSLRLLPMLAMKLARMEKKNHELVQAERIRQQIILASRQVTAAEWPKYKVMLMRQLLIGEVTARFSPLASPKPVGRPPVIMVSQRRHTMGAPVLSSPTNGMDVYKSRAMNFIQSKRASVAAASRFDDDQVHSASFSSFHSGTDRLDENGDADDNLGLTLDQDGFLI